jgi:hypothetical protein
MASQPEAPAARVLPPADGGGLPGREERTVTLDAEVETLRRENAQLRTALTSRIVIEQAKGILAERHRLSPEEAFEPLRRGARATGRPLHDLAREVVGGSRTPSSIARELDRRRVAS